VNGGSHYRNRRLCRVPEALGKEGSAHSASQSLLCRVLFLGHSAKRFAECQTALGKEKQQLRRWVMETASLPSDTRQRCYLCRVLSVRHSTKNPSLPSATGKLGKESAREGPHLCRMFGESCETLCAQT
jgi:hypothetical protein